MSIRYVVISLVKNIDPYPVSYGPYRRMKKAVRVASALSTNFDAGPYDDPNKYSIRVVTLLKYKDH